MNKTLPQRKLVCGDRKPPPKIAAILDDPDACARIAAAWPVLEKLGVAVVFELPLFCRDVPAGSEPLDPSATVLAANKILTTLEVFKEQALLDREQSKQ